MGSLGSLHKNLRYYRTANGLTQLQVARALNIDRTTYTYYELGQTKPDIYNFCKLAALFGVTLDELVDFNYSSEDLRRKYAEESDVLFKGPVEKIGYVSRDERYLIMLYRLCKDKNKALNDLLALVHSEGEQESKTQDQENAPSQTDENT